MPSWPLLAIVAPEIETGWEALAVTFLRSMLIPWDALFVKAPPVIDTGERVLTPSAAALLMLVLVSVRFCARRVPVGMPIELPVAAYLIPEFVMRLVLPGLRTRPPQSPAVVAGQTPEALWTKTDPQLGAGTVISLRLVKTAPVDVRVPWTVTVPARTVA